MDAYNSETIERDGTSYRIDWVYDTDHPAPWKWADGHGPVTDWETRDKMPSEMALSEDRNSKRFYDFAEAVRIAKRDGWGVTRQKVKRADSEPYRPSCTILNTCAAGQTMNGTIAALS